MSARQAGATNLTQGSENFGYSAVRLRRIVKLQFGIVNPNEMVRAASRLPIYRLAYLLSSNHAYPVESFFFVHCENCPSVIYFILHQNNILIAQ